MAVTTSQLCLYQQCQNRRGTLLPFLCPHPHGFTIDVMSQGGASGSPVFLTDAPKVVGMIHASFEGTNFTFAIPASLIRDGLNASMASPLDLTDVPTVEELKQQGPHTSDMTCDSFLVPRVNKT